MNALLWTLQGTLAAIFTVSGLAKISQPKQRLIAIGQTGVTPFPVPVIRFTAFCELLGAVGILLPWLLGGRQIPDAGGRGRLRDRDGWRRRIARLSA